MIRFQVYLGDNYTQEAYDQISQELGLNSPFPIRYIRYVGNAVQGDLGISYSTKRPVTQEIFARFPATVKLAGAAICFAVVIGIPLGVISAVKQYSVMDNALYVCGAGSEFLCRTSGSASCSY